jgi:hypothetical protein
MSIQQTKQTQPESEKAQECTNQLMFPHAGRDERAFLASGLGTEIAPGRFVLNTNGVYLAYLFSQSSDPQFVRVVSSTGFLSGRPLSPAAASQIAQEVNTIQSKVKDLIQNRTWPITPIAMHPRIDSDISPLIVIYLSNAKDERKQMEYAAMRHVVKDENIVIAADLDVSHRGILIAETIAQMQKREGYIHQCEECFEIIKEMLRSYVLNGEAIAAALQPPFSPGIAGATFFAHRLLPARDGGWPTLKSFMEGMIRMADERGLNTVSALFRRTEAAVRECLDEALIPAAKTMDALREYKESRAALRRCEDSF